MTQIRKAFELAFKNSALSNFRTIFRKALNETVEDNLSNELKTLIIPEPNSKNIPSLQPVVFYHLFANGVTKVIEDMFHTACRTAKIQAFNVSYGKICERTLNNMSDEEFRQAQHDVIVEYLELKGSPAIIITTMKRILECFFAQSLLNKLIQARGANADMEFTKMVDEMIRKAATDAFLFVMEETEKVPAGQYKVNFLPCVLIELNRHRTQEGDNEVFKDIIKSVLAAFIR